MSRLEVILIHFTNQKFRMCIKSHKIHAHFPCFERCTEVTQFQTRFFPKYVAYKFWLKVKFRKLWPTIRNNINLSYQINIVVTIMKYIFPIILIWYWFFFYKLGQTLQNLTRLEIIYNIFCEGGGNLHFVLTWHGDNQENMKHA